MSEVQGGFMRVLFVCVGNTCRSQMAEGWAGQVGLVTASAGRQPGAGKVSQVPVSKSARSARRVSQVRAARQPCCRG